MMTEWFETNSEVETQHATIDGVIWRGKIVYPSMHAKLEFGNKTTSDLIFVGNMINDTNPNNMIKKRITLK